MAKKLGFKVFAYSLIGTLVGGLCLGAISQFRSEKEDKKEETATEITLETFQDSANYTEVAAKYGDKIADRWIRIYLGGQLEFDNSEELGCSFILNDYDTGNYMVMMSEGIPDSNIPFEIYQIYESGGNQNDGGSYMDFYLSPGDYTFGGSHQFTIDSESVVSGDPLNVYFLNPN